MIIQEKKEERQSSRMVWLSALCFFLSFFQVSAQLNTHISEESWLPNRAVNCIFQDSEGLLWVGTASGLYRYDGAHVRHYATNPNTTNAIYTNHVTDINEDDLGNILIATESGFSSLKKGPEKFTTLSNEIERFHFFQNTGNGEKWLNYGSGKLVEVSETSNAENLIKKTLYVPLQITGEITDLVSWKGGKLLLSSNRGLFLFDTKTGETIDLQFTYQVQVMHKLKDNRIFLGTTGQGLFEVQLANEKVQVIRRYHFGKKSEAGYDQIISLSGNAEDNELLISTRKMYYHAKIESGGLTFSATPKDTDLLFDNTILTTFIDNTGIFWIGTLRGLLKVTPAMLIAERIRISPVNYVPVNHQIYHLFKENKERVWLKTRDDGSFTYNPLTGKFTKIDFSQNIQRVDKSSEGYFIAFDNQAVYRFDNFNAKPKLNEVVHTSGSILSSLEVSPGEWWFGRSKLGLVPYYSTTKPKYSHLLEKLNREVKDFSIIYTMTKDSKDNVWFGSKGHGLIKVSLSTGDITVYSSIENEEKVSRRILNIKEDSKGRIWVCSREAGLYLYNPDKDDFTQYTVMDGLPSNVISAIAEDDQNNLIISTDNGLAMYRPDQPLPFISFGEKDGIRNTDFSFNSVAEGEEGEVYFGNSNGLYKVHVNDLIDKTAPEAIYITGFDVIGVRKAESLTDTLTNKEEYLGGQKEIILPASRNDFRISFSLRDFNSAYKNKYAYRLAGHDDQWKFILNGQQTVQFLDVPPGHYVFELKAANGYGIWSTDIKRVSIYVGKPFWQTTTAFVIYFIVAVSLLYLAYYLFRRWNNLQHKLKEERELGALHDQQMIYFSDLSHEIKNRLSLLLGPLENALSGKKVNQAVLNNLYQQTMRLKKMTDQIMNIRNSEAGEFVLQVGQNKLFDSIEKICKETEAFAVVRDINLNYSLGTEPKEAWIDEELLEIILLNLLNNALKYTPSGGEVLVRSEVVELEKSDLPDSAPKPGTYLKCVVEDTGIGIPSNEIKNLFNRFYQASNNVSETKRKGAGIGLELVTRLIKKHRGFIDIQSQEGVYTHVLFYLPIEKSHFLTSELKLSTHSMVILEDRNGTLTKGNKLKPKLLLVDDEAEILGLLEQTLISDFDITKASDGEGAFELLLNQEFDLVISDLSMPRMNGLTLLQNVKRDAALCHIPFIILTGLNAESQKLTCLQSGVDDFIDKPFSPDLVKWRAKNLIENRNILKSKYSKSFEIDPKIDEEESPNELFIKQVIGLIEKHIQDNSLSVEFLAEECSMSRATFYRKMESLLGEPPSVFIRSYRLKKAAKLLKAGNYYISEIAYQTGFNNPKYFAKCFQKEFGCTPKEYVKTLASISSN